MANPHKGEVAFVADGATYTLRYSIDAICALEDKLGRGILDIAAEMQSWAPPTEVGAGGKLVPVTETQEQQRARIGRVRMGLVRATFWAALRDHHPAIDLKQAGELMVSAGGLESVAGLVGQALARAFPAPDEGGESQPSGDGVRPPQPSPPPGTGSGSSTHGSLPAPETTSRSSGG